MQVVKTLVRSDGKAKVTIFLRTDGSYGFQEWNWQEEEQAWSTPARSPVTYVESLDSALDEVLGRVPWASDAQFHQ